MLDLDPVLLARVQFAFTVSFHILFPAFTIGLASWLAVVEGLWLRTGNPVYKDIYKQWVKIFAVAFGMGVVSGVVLSYQFGTNWSVFSDKIGSVIGPLLGYEVLTAFFLEASFLGIMLFGWGRVSPRMHFASTCAVAVGTLFSAFWILSANSWMQTPQGFAVADNGTLVPTDWWEVIFSPSFPWRMAHMTVAAYLTTALCVGGVAAWYMLKGVHRQHARVMLTMAVLMVAVLAPVQAVIGHGHGENTLHYQPIKLAAMEGHWESGTHKPLILLGWPDRAAEVTHSWLSIPWGAGSLIVGGSTDAHLPGLLDVPPEDRPPVGVVFWSFRVMVGLGALMLVLGTWGAVLWARRRLDADRCFLRLCVAMAPAGWVAILAGWFVTEVGRQPWSIYGVLRTGESVSPVLGEYIALSLLAFIVVYTIVFGAGVYYILKLIRQGPESPPDETYGDHSLEATAVLGGEREA
ncbi:MAG TPA: cytochrome ubiquinol oxidase subunit I [Rhodospirillaceae bacterium]|jgi:cytochrome d ubiquinol oxidase subunit I|nr:cytochrome ubiquinol oxidase subunit I [Alphaproteobacteria bacterium]HBH26332.1 cytochrome ubiquinol oxidase subunit I [Rhodospirillaceae bacterium]